MLRLLTVMDGLHHLNGVVIITTSKNSATLDPALLRPGRFDRLIHLTLPNPENRMELFKAKTRQLGHTHKMPWEYLSLRTADMGGADIVSAINYSVLRAIVNDTVHTVETLEYGLNCVKALNNKRGKTQQLIFPT
jgi:ATP-dependent 26S proteasome regulatory subunit